MPLGVLGHIIAKLERDPGSCLGSVAANPAEARGHTQVELLLFGVFDLLATANWQRSKYGNVASRQPKATSPMAVDNTKRHGQTDRPPAEVLALLRGMRPVRDSD